MRHYLLQRILCITVPLGRPEVGHQHCHHLTEFCELLKSAAFMRVSSVILPSLIGTLKFSDNALYH